MCKARLTINDLHSSLNMLPFLYLHFLHLSKCQLYPSSCSYHKPWIHSLFLSFFCTRHIESVKKSNQLCLQSILQINPSPMSTSITLVQCIIISAFTIKIVSPPLLYLTVYCPQSIQSDLFRIQITSFLCSNPSNSIV